MKNEKKKKWELKGDFKVRFVRICVNVDLGEIRFNKFFFFKFLIGFNLYFDYYFFKF